MMEDGVVGVRGQKIAPSDSVRPAAGPFLF